MAIRTKYAPLLHLRILHDAELDLGAMEWTALSQSLKDQRSNSYNINNYLRITPAPDLSNLMARHRLRLRETPFGATLFAEVTDNPDSSDSHVLAFPFEDDVSIRFYLELTLSVFPTSANLPLDGLAQKTLYLSNKHEHQEQGQLHLTQELPGFDPTKSYQSGDLVVDDDTTPTILLEAKKTLDPAASPGADDWLRLPAALFSGGTSYEIEDRVMHGGILYEAASAGTHPAPPSAEWTEIHTPLIRTGVSADDHVLALGPTMVFPIEEEITFAKATLFDSDDVEVDSFSFFHNTGEQLQTLHFALKNQPAGFYRLEATDADDNTLENFPKNFYLDPALPNPPPFGIIELLNQAGSHSFLNEDGHPLAPTFHIRFRKRHTYWRYQFNGALKDFPPADTGDLEVDPENATRYLSTEPLPLTSGSVTLKKFGEHHLPNPDFTVVTPENSSFYSDIFINI